MKRRLASSSLSPQRLVLPVLGIAAAILTFAPLDAPPLASFALLAVAMATMATDSTTERVREIRSRRKADRGPAARLITDATLIVSDHPQSDLVQEVLATHGQGKTTEDVFTPQELEKIVLGTDTEVLYVTSEDRAEPLLQSILQLRMHKRAMTVVSPIFERLGLGSKKGLPESVRGYRFASLLELPSDRSKRVLDLIVSAILLVPFLPIMGVISLMILLTSKGPILFRQTRLGGQRDTFTFLKFRTMKNDNDDSAHQDYLRRFIAGRVEAGDQKRPVYKMRQDPRVTRVGRWLRRTSLDELPQIFNVLQGSMSLVGPRPCLAYEVEQYQDWHLMRFQSTAGLTGTWQVYGRSRVTFDDAVFLDVLYGLTRSTRQDLVLILKTIPLVLFGRGGY